MIVNVSETTPVAIFPTKKTRPFVGVQVILVFFYELTIGRPVVWRLDPVSRHHAG